MRLHEIVPVCPFPCMDLILLRRPEYRCKVERRKWPASSLGW